MSDDTNKFAAVYCELCGKRLDGSSHYHCPRAAGVQEADIHAAMGANPLPAPEPTAETLEDEGFEKPLHPSDALAASASDDPCEVNCQWQDAQDVMRKHADLLAKVAGVKAELQQKKEWAARERRAGWTAYAQACEEALLLFAAAFPSDPGEVKQ